MHDLVDVAPRRSQGLDRRSFLRATGIIAVSTITGGAVDRTDSRNHQAAPPARKSRRRTSKPDNGRSEVHSRRHIRIRGSGRQISRSL